MLLLPKEAEIPHSNSGSSASVIEKSAVLRCSIEFFGERLCDAESFEEEVFFANETLVPEYKDPKVFFTLH